MAKRGLSVRLRPKPQLYVRSTPVFSRKAIFGLERRVARRVYGRGAERDQWLRQTMFQHVDSFFRGLPPEDAEVLEVSGSFYGDFPWKHYESWKYPDFDLCRPGALSRRFDVVICDQVLEHVVDPCLAARTLADLCEPGGHVIIGVPFLIKIHPAPNDYWRFTPDGLRLLVEQAGLDPIDVRGWGNRHCVNANFLVWAKRPAWASLTDEPEFPVNVWAIARKPLAT